MASRVKMWLKPADRMDLWLDAQGYYRKHTARDGSCLFRVVSEQLFLTQAFHLEVRRHCIQFGYMYKDVFQNMTSNPIKDCLDRLRCPSEGGGDLELKIISLMYRCDFILFQEVGKPPIFATNNGFNKKIMLCLSQERHYDSVYTKENIANAAFCQSLIYDKLYKDVFGLLEVDYAVKKMLRDKTSRYQRDQSCFLPSGMALRLEMRDNCINVKELLNLGVTPFPYKVAKSLDPEIYRNVEFDTWNEYRKGLRYAGRVWNCHELGPGVRCLVKLEEDKVFHAFVQEMEPNKGPVLVFIEEMGKKMTVPYDSLELITQSTTTQNPPVPLKHLRHVQNSKGVIIQPQPDSAQSSKKNHRINKIKTKDCHGIDRKRRSSTPVDSSNQSNMSTTSVPVVSSSDSYHQEHDYQHQHDIYDNYQNQTFVTQNCEVTSSVSEVEENVNVDTSHQITPQVVQTSPCPPNTLYPLNMSPDSNNNFPSSSQPYCAVNIIPNKSLLPDGSDLPFSVHTSPPGAACYPVVQSPTQYLPEQSHLSYVNMAYEKPPQQIQKPAHQAVAIQSDTTPMPVICPVREPVTSSPGGISITSESESSNYSVTHSSSLSHHVAPRFKNKRKVNNSSINSNNSKNITSNNCNNSYTTSRDESNGSVQQNSKNKGMSLIQQPEVSTTTCSTPVAPMTPVPPIPPLPHPSSLTPSLPPPPPPPPLPPPSASSNHYFPVQSSYSPPAAGPPTFYFHPVECDNYCPVGVTGYIEYSVFEQAHSGVYPAVLSQPPPPHPPPPPAQFSTAPYVTADGVYYQQIVSPAAI